MINRVLFYNSGGGIGDAVQILPLIDTLKNSYKNANFFYLCSHQNHFNSTLIDLNSKITSLDLGLKYFGFRWWHSLKIKKIVEKNKIEKFDLIIDLQSKIRNTILLKMIPHKYFISTTFNFKFSKPSLNIKKQKRINETIINAINHILNTKIKLNEYNINKIDKKFFLESDKLLPNDNYVGLSITQGNVYRKKEWPLDKIIKISNVLLEYKKIPVFFIEKKNKVLKDKISNLVPKAIFPEHKTNIVSAVLVTCLGKKLDFVITIDNGIMHLLSLSKVPMISLFGPTDPEKFAPLYEKSIVLDSKKIYNNSSISSISVEDVLKAAKQYLNFSD